MSERPVGEAVDRYVIGTAAVLILLAIRAACLFPLWGWFVAPLGVPVLGFWWALGVVLAYDVLAMKGVRLARYTLDEAVAALWPAALVPMIPLLIGWAVVLAGLAP